MSEQLGSIRFERIWAMPNKETFKIKPIRELLEEEITGKLWVDSFAGWNSPADYTNDLNPNAPTNYHKDALEYLKWFGDNSVNGVLFDPPYSFTQVKQCHESIGADKMLTTATNMKYWASVKNEMARIIKPGGKVICFGWSSQGLGKNRGFTLIRVLLVPHGGSKNDTMVTVEVKSDNC